MGHVPDGAGCGIPGPSTEACIPEVSQLKAVNKCMPRLKGASILDSLVVSLMILVTLCTFLCGDHTTCFNLFHYAACLWMLSHAFSALPFDARIRPAGSLSLRTAAKCLGLCSMTNQGTHRIRCHPWGFAGRRRLCRRRLRRGKRQSAFALSRVIRAILSVTTAVLSLAFVSSRACATHLNRVSNEWSLTQACRNRLQQALIGTSKAARRVRPRLTSLDH